MLAIGLALLAVAIIGLWLCLPGKDSKLKPYLRRGADVLAAIVITGAFGLGIIVSIASIGRY